MEDSLKNIEDFLSTTKYTNKFKNGFGDQTFVEAVENIAAVIPVLRSMRTCDVVVASSKLVSIMASAAVPSLGPFAAEILSLCSAILGTIWKDNQHTDSTIIEGIESKELKARVKGILATFHISESYLRTVELEFQDTNQKDIDHMLSVIDLYQGSEILGYLRCKIENGINLKHVEEADRIICLVNLYVRIAAIGSSMLWRMFSILISCKKKWLGVWKMNDPEVTHTSDVIGNIIKKEDSIHKQCIMFLTDPDCNTITIILTVFNPSERIEISTFVRSLGMEFQRLSDVLQGEFSISSERWKDYELIMSRNGWGSIWGSYRPTENQNLFKFQEVSTEDNIFTIWSIRWPSWYVHMTCDRRCRGFDKSSREIGPQAQWKILRLKNGRFVMSPLQWPCTYAHISKYGFSHLMGRYQNPGESGTFIFKPK